MECHEAESLVSRYVNNTLSVEELKPFLKHIHECSSCKEELETYFIVEKALEQLEKEDDDTTLNMIHLLEEDIKEKDAMVLRSKYVQLMVWFFTMLGIIILAFLLYIAGSEMQFFFH